MAIRNGNFSRLPVGAFPLVSPRPKGSSPGNRKSRGQNVLAMIQNHEVTSLDGTSLPAPEVT
jgi:hypothetical protein